MVPGPNLHSQFAQGLLSELGPLDSEGMAWEPKGRVEAVTGPCHPVYNNPWARGDTGVRHAMYTSAGKPYAAAMACSITARKPAPEWTCRDADRTDARAPHS